MINLPHIGLYGDLSACEDGMIDALNRNFSLLDAIVQLKVLDFVNDLPDLPAKGDVYILNTPLDPSTDKDLMIFNGTNWVQIIPQDGFIAYIDSQEAFYYYNDGEWIKDLTDLSEIKLKLGRATSTGVIDGLNLSTTSGDNAKFDIAVGIYEIVDLSDVNNPVVKTIEYVGSTENVVTNLATQDVTYISLDEDGVIHQSINFPTPNERRQYAFVGRLNHTNRTSISFADTFPDFKLSPVASFYDLVDALAPFKMDQGLKTTPNGANLSFDVSAGKVFFRSDNYTTDKNNPHTKTFNDQVLAPFRKMTQTSTVDAADVTVLEPSYYDVAGVRTLIAGGPSQATIQRIYKYKSGAIRVAYGQNIYTNLNDAREAVNFDSFVENPTINQTAVLIALVIITKGCTDLSDPSQCVILPASRFGSVSGGGGGGSGSGVMVVSDLTARNNIPEGTRTNGMLVQVISTDTIYKLIGLPAGATTTDANWDHVITGKASQVITNKDIDGGTASNTSRLTMPKDTIENLRLLNRKVGTEVYNLSGPRGMIDDGSLLRAIPDHGDLSVMRQLVASDMIAEDFQVNPLADLLTLTKVDNALLGPCFQVDVAASINTDGFTFRPLNDIIVPKSFRGQRVQFTYDYASEITQGSIAFEILDQTNSVVIVSRTELQARPSATGINTKGFIYFTIPANCQALRIYMLRPSGSATITSKKFWFNNWEIKKFSTTLGPVVTDWQSYTPTGSWATNTSYIGRWRRVGDSLEVDAVAVLTGAPTATDFTLTIPSGMTIDTAKLSSIDANKTLGTMTAIVSGGYYHGSLWYSTTTSVKASATLFAASNTNNLINLSATTPTTFANNDRVYVKFSVPIQGWSSTARYADYTLNQDVSLRAGISPANMSITTTEQPVIFNVKYFDSADILNTSTGVVKAVSGGLYLLSVNSNISGTATAGAEAFIRIRNKTTSEILRTARFGYQSNSGATNSLDITVLGVFSANDEIEVTTWYTGTIASATISPIVNIAKLATSQQLFAPIGPVGFNIVGTNGANITNTLSTIIFITKRYDSHGAFNLSTGEYVIPEDGVWEFGVVAGTISNVPTSDRIIVDITVGGVGYAGRLAGVGTSNEIFPQSNTGPINLKKGDIVKCATASVSGTYSLSTSTAANRFYGKKVN